jgi:hypothetical protein
MDKSRLIYLSYGSRITIISVLVRELQSLQFGVSVQSTFRNSFGCDQFLPNLIPESEKVFCSKVVDKFIICPTI